MATGKTEKKAKKQKNKYGLAKGKWYQNNWFILMVSVALVFMLVISVFLSQHWGTIERTILGNKLFYYKMEMDNFSKLKDKFASSVEYSHDSKHFSEGKIKFGSAEKSINPLSNLEVDVSYWNNDDEDFSKASLTMKKKDTESSLSQIELYLDNKGLFMEFPQSGYANSTYKTDQNITRQTINYNWWLTMNNEELRWTLFDILQDVNDIIPSEKVYHYGSVDFNGWQTEKIEFIFDEQLQQDIKNIILEKISKKEYKQLIQKLETTFFSNVRGKGKGNGNGKKVNLYKKIREYLDGMLCNNGDIVFSIIYDGNQNILSREIIMNDNRIQLLTYDENEQFVLAFFNEKAGINIENKCTFNRGAKGVRGRLVVDSGIEEVGVVYELTGITDGFLPVGDFEVVAGRTGVAEATGGAVPVWKGKLLTKKDNNTVNIEFKFEQNQKELLSLFASFNELEFKNKDVERMSKEEINDSKNVSELSMEKLLSEMIWNYTLMR